MRFDRSPRSELLPEEVIAKIRLRDVLEQNKLEEMLKGGKDYDKDPLIYARGAISLLFTGILSLNPFFVEERKVVEEISTRYGNIRKRTIKIRDEYLNKEFLKLILEADLSEIIDRNQLPLQLDSLIFLQQAIIFLIRENKQKLSIYEDESQVELKPDELDNFEIDPDTEIGV